MCCESIVIHCTLITWSRSASGPRCSKTFSLSCVNVLIKKEATASSRGLAVQQPLTQGLHLPHWSHQCLLNDVQSLSLFVCESYWTCLLIAMASTIRHTWPYLAGPSFFFDVLSYLKVIVCLQPQEKIYNHHNTYWHITWYSYFWWAWRCGEERLRMWEWYLDCFSHVLVGFRSMQMQR